MTGEQDRRRLVRWHRRSLYALLAVCLASVIGGVASPLVVGLAAAAMLAAVAAQRRGWLRGVSQNVWNALVLVALALSVAELLVPEMANPVATGVRFILLLLVVKLASRAGPRDEWQLYALSFLLFSASTLGQGDLVFGVFFVTYVLVGTASLVLFHLRMEADAHHEARGRIRTGGLPLPRRAALGALVGGMGALILAASLGLFFTFPRVGFGFFAQPERDGVNMTGLADEVAIGGHGRLRDNPEVVMRVEFLEGNPPVDAEWLHWRAMSFDHYDGVRWIRTEADKRAVGAGALLSREGDGYRLERLFEEETLDWAEGRKLRRFRVYLEPLGVNILPALWPTTGLRLVQAEGALRFSPHRGFLDVDGQGDLTHTIRSEYGILYEFNAIAEPDPRLLLKADAAPASAVDERAAQRRRARYLQLPERLTPRFHELAEQIVEGQATPYAKGLAVVDYLEANYGYTTDLPVVDATNPVESFLFRTRRGHCEYFATSAALLLRSAGVEARVVNGFLGGTWNELSGHLAVRQGDAHSWIEIWVPGWGWTPLDPTPPAGTQPRRPDALEAAVRSALDAARLFWVRGVIEYDLEAQIRLVKRLSRLFAPQGALQATGLDTGRNADRAGEPAQEKGDLIASLRPWLGVVGYALLCLSAFVVTRRRSFAHPRRAWLLMMLYTVCGAAWVGWFWGIERNDGPAIGLGALGAGLSVALAFLVQQPRSPGRRRSAQVALLFDLLERAGQRAGLPRASDEGPGAYLDRLAVRFPPAAADLDQFKRRYLAARFSSRPLSGRTHRAMRTLVIRIRRGLRRA